MAGRTTICPRCGGCPEGAAPLAAPLEGGCELDGRPLSASEEVVATWLRSCGGYGLEWPSMEAVQSLVDRGMSEEAQALAIEGSWIFEESNPEVAVMFREAVLWLLRRQEQPDAMLLCELHRRLGHFDSALRMAIRAQAATPNPAIAAVLGTQAVLAGRRDRGRHAMVDALAAAGVR